MASKINKGNMLENILKEIKNLRGDLSMFLPSESTNDYVHSSRIKKSYKVALKQYPRLQSN